jgi:hypothetical protein
MTGNLRVGDWLRRRAAIGLALLCVVVVGSCVGPARTAQDYRLKASSTAGSVRGAVETARLGVLAAARGRITANYLSVLIGGAEDDASSAQSTFESIQSPGVSSDGVRHQVLGTVGDAVSTLSHLRALVRRGDMGQLTRAARALPSMSQDLKRLQDANGG